MASAVMASTAPFALFEQHPANAAVSDTHHVVGTRLGGGAAAVPPAGDWSGPMLPFEVRNSVFMHSYVCVCCNNYSYCCEYYCFTAHFAAGAFELGCDS